MTPIRRPVPMPGNMQSNTMRNMSASAFNLNHNSFGNSTSGLAYSGNLQQPPNPWGFSSMNQVHIISYTINVIPMSINKILYMTYSKHNQWHI